MSNQTLRPATPIFIPSSSDAVIEVANATFYRTQNNTNISITLPVGTSQYGYYASGTDNLPAGAFNSTITTENITFPTADRALIAKDINALHSINIQFKLTKSDGTNYTNLRELRCYLVGDDGVTAYSSAVYSNNQPGTGFVDKAQINGVLTHASGDVVKLMFQLAQNDAGDSSDTTLTIFRIDWYITL